MHNNFNFYLFSALTISLLCSLYFLQDLELMSQEVVRLSKLSISGKEKGDSDGSERGANTKEPAKIEERVNPSSSSSTTPSSLSLSSGVKEGRGITEEEVGSKDESNSDIAATSHNDEPDSNDVSSS